MENKNIQNLERNVPATTLDIQNVLSDGHLQLQTWQEFYQCAQQLYEDGYIKQAESYYAVAQQLYEESDADVGPQIAATEHTDEIAEEETVTPSPRLAVELPSEPPTHVDPVFGEPPPSRPAANSYDDINSISGATPVFAGQAGDRRISGEALEGWATEYSSQVQDSFDSSKGLLQNEKAKVIAVGLALVIVALVGYFLFKLNQPTSIKMVAPSTPIESSVKKNRYFSSKPSATNSSWSRSRNRTGTRSKPHRGKARRRARPKKRADNGLASLEQKTQKNLSDDPMGNFEL